jgi:hypothetical protein
MIIKLAKNNVNSQNIVCSEVKIAIKGHPIKMKLANDSHLKFGTILAKKPIFN